MLCWDEQPPETEPSQVILFKKGQSVLKYNVFWSWTVSEHLRANSFFLSLLCAPSLFPCCTAISHKFQDCVILCLVSKVFQAPILNHQRFLNFLSALQYQHCSFYFLYWHWILRTAWFRKSWDLKHFREAVGDERVSVATELIHGAKRKKISFVSELEEFFSLHNVPTRKGSTLADHITASVSSKRGRSWR